MHPIRANGRFWENKYSKIGRMIKQYNNAVRGMAKFATCL